MPDIKIHLIQAEILVNLLYKPEALFSELTNNNLTNDHISFHVNRLLSEDFIIKSDGKYSLSQKGKEFANRFDEQDRSIVKQAKNSVVTIITKQQNGKDYFLMQQRLKQPYFGYWGGVGGKINWGETSIEAAQRELLEETGLSANLSLACIEHKIDLDPNNTVLEDKLFYLYKGTNCTGNLIEEFQGGKNMWLTAEEILDGREIFSDVVEFIKLVSTYKNGNPEFIEKKFKESRY